MSSKNTYTYDEIMKTFVEMMSKGPEYCRECTKRHFMGCNGCPNKQYWDNIKHA